VSAYNKQGKPLTPCLYMHATRELCYDWHASCGGVLYFSGLLVMVNTINDSCRHSVPHIAATPFTSLHRSMPPGVAWGSPPTGSTPGPDGGSNQRRVWVPPQGWVTEPKLIIKDCTLEVSSSEISYWWVTCTACVWLCSSCMA
jgi:hypothetical protein